MPSANIQIPTMESNSTLGLKNKLQEHNDSCNKIQVDVPKKRDGIEEASLLKTLENHLKQLKLSVVFCRVTF